MKLSAILPILLILIVSQGCEFEVNTLSDSLKKDPIPHSSFESKGISSYPATMSVDGEPATSNIFTFGTKVKFEFNNVTGFKKIKGLVFPGMKMTISDDAGNSIYQVDDLLNEFDSGTDLSPLLLDAKFNVDLPHMNNEKYIAEIILWDKKGNGTYTFSLPFTVKASDVLTIKKNELDYSNIYFWDDTDKKVVLNESIDVTHKFILINEGLEGFEEVDGMVYPGLAFTVLDKDGNIIVSTENVFSNVVDSGISPEDLKNNQAPVTLTFNTKISNNPCNLSAKIFDLKNPDSFISITSKLIVE